MRTRLVTIVHFVDADSARAASMPRSMAGTARLGAPRHVRSLAAGGELFQVHGGDVSRLAGLPGVAAVEEDLVVTATAIVDPLWKRQWYMHDPKVGVDAEVAWRHTRGAGAVVAVLDTGVTPHPEFDDQLLPGYDFVSDAAAARDGDGRDANPADEGDWRDAGDCGSPRIVPSSWHGSHVAGLVVARSGNRPGIVGLCARGEAATCARARSLRRADFGCRRCDRLGQRRHGAGRASTRNVVPMRST